MIIIQAKDHLDAQGLSRESASLLADAVVARLNDGADVEISLSGLNGMPSSYFNVVLLRIMREFGVDAINRRVKFQFDTEVQRQVFQRSFDAAAKSVA
jgi:STAS-like domain of unknown function (DUF4325)